jgi:hypothetical protein
LRRARARIGGVPTIAPRPSRRQGLDDVLVVLDYEQRHVRGFQFRADHAADGHSRPAQTLGQGA